MITALTWGYKDTANNVPNPKKGVPSYNDDPQKKVVVSYSSINGNGLVDTAKW